MLITSKRQFYELSSKGLCGNTPMVWWSLDDFFSQSYRPKHVTIRSLDFGSSFHKPIIDVKNLKGIIESTVDRSYVINEIPDLNANRIIQGEFTWINGQWYFYYSRFKEPMRIALEKGGANMYGRRVMEVLKGACTPSDYEDLMWVFDKYSIPTKGRYPVIELTVFDSCVGSIPRRNTLIWEVRSTY